MGGKDLSSSFQRNLTKSCEEDVSCTRIVNGVLRE